MPRKRRLPKARHLPAGLGDVSLAERAAWSCMGPVVGDGAAWPDWDAWARFYGAVRQQLFADRPWLAERSVAEHLYTAWRAGRRDLDGLRRELMATLYPDPRRHPTWRASE